MLIFTLLIILWLAVYAYLALLSQKTKGRIDHLTFLMWPFVIISYIIKRRNW